MRQRRVQNIHCTLRFECQSQFFFHVQVGNSPSQCCTSPSLSLPHSGMCVCASIYVSSHIRRGGKWVKQSASLPSFLESNRREAPKRETVEEGESDMLPSLSHSRVAHTRAA